MEQQLQATINMKGSSSQCFSCLRKSGYEEIGDISSPQRHQPSSWWVKAAACVVLGATALFHWRPTPAEGPHETVPTLLSLVDPCTGAFVHAQWNPVYDRLGQQTIQFSRSSVLDNGDGVVEAAVHLTGEREKPMWNLQGLASIHESRRRHRHRGRGRHGRGVGTDWMKQDLFLLQCSQDRKELELSAQVNVSNVREAATYDQLEFTTSGSWKVAVPPLRYAYCQWLLVSHVGTAPFVQAASPILSMPHTTEPANIHLAYTKDPSTLLVHFTSTAPGTPVVQLNHDTIVKENIVTDTYGAADMCQAPANMTGPGQFQSPGYLHTVPLVNLHPSTTYTYQVGLETGQGVTWRQEEMKVTTSPATGSATPYAFVVYGDQGCPLAGWDVGKAWMKGMVEREKDNKVQAIHHFGDLSYAQGAAHQWDAWLDMIEPASSKWPLMVSVGNHEYDYTKEGDVTKDPSGSNAPYQPRWGNYGLDSGGECGVPTAKRFHMPETGNGVFWYSYDSGLVHTIVLSTEHDMSHHSRQRKWLVEDLMSVDRSQTPWIVLEVHRPLYEGEAIWANNNVGIALRMEVEDLLYDFRVDIVLAGHYHAYHRTCDGLYRDICNQEGPIYLTIGTAGARLDAANVNLLDESWTKKMILQMYGYGRITVHNATALHFQFIQHGSSDDASAGTVLDDIWIQRERS